MRIPDHKIQEVLQKSPIVDVVGAYVALTNKGDRYWGLSPFKNEKTPSFSVSPDKGAYYCFSTSQGGNAISFIMELEHLGFPEAVRFLAKKYGVALEESEEDPKGKQARALEELYQRLAGSFRYFLRETESGKVALDYVLGRGFSPECIEAFSLGYAPQDPRWLHRFLRGKGYSTDILAASGLFSRKHSDWAIFSHRLMFPIANLYRQTVAFGGRLLSGEGPKYINSPETPIYHKGSTLFGLDQAKDSIRQKGEVIICEGYMDVMALHQAGLTQAVAPLGTAFTEEQGQLLRRQAKKLILLFDGDAAGIQATMRTLIIAERLEFDSWIIPVPDAKDPAEILQRDGSQNLAKIVDLSLHAFDYLLRTSTKGLSLRSPEGREQLIRNFVPYFQAIPTEVRKAACVSMLADVLSLDPAMIMRDLSRGGSPGPARAVRQDPVSSVPPRVFVPPISREFRVMVVVFLHSRLFADFRNHIGVEDLQDPVSIQLYVALEEAFRAQESDFEACIARLDHPGLVDWLRKKHLEDEYGQDVEAYVKDGIKTIRISLLQGRRVMIEQQLSRFSSQAQGDEALGRALLEEKMILDKALKDLQNNE